VMAWFNPVALAGLALLVIPVLVHLLLRHRARRVPFPSLRFVRSSRTAAARLRIPSDLLLLLLRLAIISTAVIALAQPLLITPARLGAWNTRIARAILLDRSESMKPLTEAAQRAAATEARSASSAFHIDITILPADLRRAVAMLRSAPPGRREIVVVSDFQVGMLAEADFRDVPEEIGLRFVQVGDAVSEQPVRGIDVLSATGVQRQDLLLSTDATRIRRLIPQPVTGGLSFLFPAASSDDVERLRRAVTAAGTPAPSAAEPITVAFAHAAVPADVKALRSGWMVDATLRLKRDMLILEACGRTRPATVLREGHPWHTLFLDRDGRPLVRAAATGDSLLLDIAAPPDAFLAAAVVRGALIARQNSRTRADGEVRRMSPADLGALTRPAAPVTGDQTQVGGSSDARWCWTLVLILLILETIVRRQRSVVVEEPRSNAA
jgi:hypothetical protein